MRYTQTLYSFEIPTTLGNEIWPRKTLLVQWLKGPPQVGCQVAHAMKCFKL
jgi:hypothetical protein